MIATARRGHERLQHLKGAGAAILGLGIDVLVNNAGYVEAALVEELEYTLPTP